MIKWLLKKMFGRCPNCGSNKTKHCTIYKVDAQGQGSWGLEVLCEPCWLDRPVNDIVGYYGKFMDRYWDGGGEDRQRVLDAAKREAEANTRHRKRRIWGGLYPAGPFGMRLMSVFEMPCK